MVFSLNGDEFELGVIEDFSKLKELRFFEFIVDSFINDDWKVLGELMSLKLLVIFNFWLFGDKGLVVIFKLVDFEWLSFYWMELVDKNFEYIFLFREL